MNPLTVLQSKWLSLGHAVSAERYLKKRRFDVFTVNNSQWMSCGSWGGHDAIIVISKFLHSVWSRIFHSCLRNKTWLFAELQKWFGVTKEKGWKVLPYALDLTKYHSDSTKCSNILVAAEKDGKQVFLFKEKSCKSDSTSRAHSEPFLLHYSLGRNRSFLNYIEKKHKTKIPN